MSACGRFTCCDVMLGVLRSIWMFGLVLCVVTVAPSAGETQDNPGLAYVVSPPPATRGLMPNYLPKLPPESTATVPRVSMHRAPGFRAGCRSCQPRPRHVRRRHRLENPAARHRYRRAGHRIYHRHGHFEQRRPHLPRHHMKRSGGSHRHAPRRWHGASGFPTQCCIAMLELRRSAAICGIDAFPPARSCADCNHAAMNQQVAIIDPRKSQVSPTSAAVLRHFMSASNRTRGDADWRLGGT